MPGRVSAWLKRRWKTMRLARFFDPEANPWERLDIAIAARCFGEDSQVEFSTYLEGPSSVTVDSVEALCDWLRGCEAVEDHVLFQRNDVWQHPCSFEKLRRGDCEDHALWAWRHLGRLEVPAHFTVGLWGTVAHAWVGFVRDGTEFLMETTCKRGPMIQPRAPLEKTYIPALAIDTRGQTFVYQGYQHLLRQMNQDRRAAAAVPTHPRPSARI